MNMRCTQPYISLAGKLAQQIQRLRSFGLSNPDFSQQIASRYSSFKLGMFPLVTLTLLQQARSPNYFNVLHQNLLRVGESNVFNVTQILKNEVINPPASTIQPKFNFNFLFFGNRVVLRRLGGESNYQLPKLRPELLTFSQSNSIPIARTFQLPTQLSKELKDQQPWLGQNVFLLRSQADFLARPLSIQSQKVGKDSIVKLVPKLLAEVRGKEKGLKETKPKNNFYPLLNQGLSNLGNSFTNTKVPSEIELNQVDAGINKYHESVNLISRQNDREAGDLPQENRDRVEISDFPRLKQTSTSMLIHSVKMSRIISTLESKFNLFQRQQNIETTSILQSRKTSLNYYDDLSLSPHHIHRRRSNQQRLLINELSPTSEEFIFRRQVDHTAANNQSPRNYAFSQATAMEFAQSQVIAKPISSRQESEMDRKNNWEKQRKANFSPPSIDINRLTDQVYQAIERKIKIERQRRGLL